MFDIKTKTSEYASIVVTHECNRRCPWCIDAYRGSREWISLDILHKRLPAISAVQNILLVGGEPTLHPQIKEIAEHIKNAGFNVIMTTNYSRPDIVASLDGIVDSFNISFYGQDDLPNQRDFVSDLTLCALIHRDHLNTRMLLDAFIDQNSHNLNLKFSTLSVCNEWTHERQKVDYLDSLNGERVKLFDEIEGILYRGFVIKRYDRVLNPAAAQSLKLHVDGHISNSWVRP